MVVIDDAIPPMISVVNRPATPPFVPPCIQRFQAEGFFHAPDTSTQEGLAEALATADMWIKERNIPIKIVEAWRSFDVEKDPSKLRELGIFKRESIIRGHCMVSVICTLGSHYVSTFPPCTMHIYPCSDLAFFRPQQQAAGQNRSRFHAPPRHQEIQGDPARTKKATEARCYLSRVAHFSNRGPATICCLFALFCHLPFRPQQKLLQPHLVLLLSHFRRLC